MSDTPLNQDREHELSGGRVEKREARETPDQLSNDYLIEGERMTDELKSELEKAREEAHARSDKEGERELKRLEKEAEEAKEELTHELAFERAERVLYDVDTVKDLSRIIEAGQRSSELKRQVLEMWKSELGSKAAERLFDDAGYRAEVLALSLALQQPIREGGPSSMPDANLKNTIIMFEALGAGAVELVRANDLTNHTQDLDFNMAESRGAFFINESSVDVESGELKTKVYMSLVYKDKDGESAEITRKFIKMKLGDGSFEKMAEHIKFELPLSLQEDGIAAKIIAASLEHYENLGMDAIEMNANINVGSYAWAQYGFGYATEQHTDEGIKEMADSYEAALASVIQQLELGELAYDEDQNKEVLAFKDEAMGKRLQPLLEQLKASRTPQETAAVGVDGPFFCRDKSANWHLFDSRAEAKTFSAKLRKEGDEDKDYSGVMHAGKLALMNKLWRGRLELKRNGPQKGKNLDLLKSALERRLQNI
jgi:hypothetical protein